MTKPKCAANGVKNKGSMCSQIIVNGKLCGYDGDCEHKEGHKPNQYALGYKAGLEAAVKVCDKVWREETANSIAVTAVCRAGLAIAALPVPEVQWRNLTPQEVTDAIREGAADGGWQGFAERIIAKFKEKQL